MHRGSRAEGPAFRVRGEVPTQSPVFRLRSHIRATPGVCSASEVSRMWIHCFTCKTCQASVERRSQDPLQWFVCCLDCETAEVVRLRELARGLEVLMGRQ